MLKCCDDFFSIFHAIRRMTRSLLLLSADSFSSLSVSNSESALIQLWRFLILHYRIVKCDNSRTEQNTILARGEKKSSKRIHKHVACGFNTILHRTTAKRLRGKKENNKTWFCDMRKETRSQKRFIPNEEATERKSRESLLHTLFLI